MSKQERLLTNKTARETPEPELVQILCAHFEEVNGHGPSAAQEVGLREAAQWIREGQVVWSQVEQAITDDTWDPADGPRDILGPG